MSWNEQEWSGSQSYLEDGSKGQKQMYSLIKEAEKDKSVWDAKELHRETRIF